MSVLGAAYSLVLTVYLAASQLWAQTVPYWGDKIKGVEGFAPFVRPEWWQPFEDPLVFGAAYSSVMLAATLLWLFSLRRAPESGVSPENLSRWSMVFAAILVFSTPVLLPDFWLSVGWGLQVAGGSNPYYVDMRDAIDVSELPGPNLWKNKRMTYGPLWALISGAVALLAQKKALLMAALFKLLAFGAWALSVRVVYRLMEKAPPEDRRLSVVFWGWCPLALVMAMGDGHNDLFMVLPSLLWLYWLENGKPFRAALALASAVLVKYAALPLFLLHGIRLALEKKYREAALSTLCAAAFMLAVFAVFYRSPDFFEEILKMQRWKFFTPAAIAKLYEGPGAMRPVNGAILCLAALQIGRYVRRPSQKSFRSAVLWAWLGVMLAVVGHVWPWFVLWALPFAALRPRSKPAIFTAALGITLSFVFSVSHKGIVGVIISDGWKGGPAGTTVYVITLALFLAGMYFARRRPAA